MGSRLLVAVGTGANAPIRSSCATSSVSSSVVCVQPSASGHFVATGGDPVEFLMKFHDRIASFHLKDRTTPANGQKNLPWGTGDTPLTALLQTVKKNKWTMPATIELEYEVPEGSDAVKEVKKCLEYCKNALA